MAVRLDIEAVRGAVAPEVFHAAEELLTSDGVGEVAEIGGGAAAIVTTGPDMFFEAWAGVVSGEFKGECDGPGCADEAEGLCKHAVAVTLAAMEDAFAWSSDASPPSAIARDPRVHALVELALAVPPERLARLVAECAAQDTGVEARLRSLAR